MSVDCHNADCPNNDPKIEGVTEHREEAKEVTERREESHATGYELEGGESL